MSVYHFEQALKNLATLESIRIDFQKTQDCIFGIQIARKLEEGLD